jgi:hypothetical protein
MAYNVAVYMVRDIDIFCLKCRGRKILKTQNISLSLKIMGTCCDILMLFSDSLAQNDLEYQILEEKE